MKTSIYKLSLMKTVLFIVLLQSVSLRAESVFFEQAEPQNLKVYVEQIIGTGTTYRNYKNTEELNRVSSWIKEQMQRFGIPCQFQTYAVEGKDYRNIICSLNTGAAEKYLIGAHCDVHGQQQGADDNASGVAGVVETARILAQEKNRLKKNIEFVFYTLEEPPFFKTEQMGSYRHAQSIKAQKKQIKGVYILEMIGFYDSALTQTYPLGLKWVYPAHANFIAVVSNLQSRTMGEDYCAAMSELDQLQCERLVAPAFVKGVDFSDHLNYWSVEIPAVMLTDTAFFRNKNYHTAQDTMKTLNFEKMSHVVDGLVYTLLK